MRASAHVRSVPALEDFKGALACFVTEAQMAIEAARQEIRRTEEWLQQRLAYWQTEVLRCQEEVRQAEAALNRCRSAGHYDPYTGVYYVPPCIAEQQAVQQAHLRLQKAQEELGNVQRWKYWVDEAASAYSIQSEQMNRYLLTELLNAIFYIGEKIRELRDYLADVLPSETGFPYSFPPPENAEAGLAPSTSPEGMGVEWVDMGIQTVELDRIHLSDSPVNGTGDFNKVSAQEMEEGLRKLLDVVMPAVAQGADGEYFSRLDGDHGLGYAEGYRRIYDAFYGHGCIRLNQMGDGYLVVNGYHRLFVARQLGIKALPARVFAPQLQ